MEQRPIVHSFPPGSSITALDSSPNVPILLLGDSHGSVHIYHTPRSFTHLTTVRSYTDQVDRETNSAESCALVAVKHLYWEPGGVAFLAGNEKTVKLWKVTVCDGRTAKCRKVFASGHKCHVHSVSVSPSQQHFISADDLRINIWDVNHSVEAYCLADYTPVRISALREVLVYAGFSHREAALVLFTSTAGVVRVGDLRARASLLPPVIELKDGGGKTGGYSDLAGAVTGADFSDCGNLIYARNLGQVKVWDVRSPSQCVSVVPIVTAVPNLLTDLEARFQVKSYGTNTFVTGGLGSELVVSTETGEKTSIDLGLGSRNLPTVTCNLHGSQIFAAAGNKVALVETDEEAGFLN